MLHRFLVALLALAALIALACGLSPDAAPAPAPAPSPSTAPPASSAPSAPAPDPVRVVTHAGARFATLRVDLDTHTIHLLGQRPEEPTTLAAARAWATRRGLAFTFATNAGIFDPGRRPLGLTIEGGETLRPLNRDAGEGNFFLAPNGVFLVGASGARVVRTDEYTPEPGDVLATQSGPILVRDGALHPAFQPDSTSLRTRSGVGVDSDGQVHFALSQGSVNFHTFATFFRDALGCPDALYLDGEISDYESAAREATMRLRYGGVLLVTRVGAAPSSIEGSR